MGSAVVNPQTDNIGAVPVVEDQLAIAITLTSPLLDRQGGKIVLDAHNWDHQDKWDTIICPSVLVSRQEVLLLLAERLNLSRNKAGMLRVSRCQISLGQHVTVTTASNMRLHYWGTGSYCRLSPKKWPYWVEVEGYETARSSGRKTSRLAYVVCGIQLKQVSLALGRKMPKPMREVKGKHGKDSLTFLLVRYAQAHPSSNRRGPEHRPLCPGPLEATHCLWTWATRPVGYRRGCFRPRPWERHRRYFGQTREHQMQVKESEARAWYDIIQVTTIGNYVSVQEDVDADGEVAFLQSLLFT